MIRLDKHTNLELAFMAIMGYLGNGEDRKTTLGKRYERVQQMVNDITINKTIPDSDAYSRLEEIGHAMTVYVMEGETE